MEKQNLLFGFYNENFQIDPKTLTTLPKVTEVRNRTVNMLLSFGNLLWNKETLAQTYVLEIDYKKAEAAHTASLPLGGFASMICFDYAEKAREIALSHCQEQGLNINQELNHWPKLQFIVSAD